MHKPQPAVSIRQSSYFGQDEESESYSSSSSFVDSYSDSSELANWEEYVGDNGTLFYAEYMSQKKKQTPTNKKCMEFSRSSSKRMMGKKLTRRQNNRQRQQHSAKTNNDKQLNQNEVKSHEKQNVIQFSDIKSYNYIKQLELVITAADRYRFGRRSTAVESILGFRVVPFPDQPECLMIDSFVHEMPTMQQQEQIAIKRGDWFRGLDNIDIRTSNVDELLLQFVEPTKVCLKFQGAPTEVDSTSNSLIEDDINFKIIENFSTFAEQFENLMNVSTEQMPITEITPNNNPHAFVFLLLPPECYQNDDHKGSLYFYPENPITNFLYKTRGSFLTLNAVLTEELQTNPRASKILVDNVQYYVNYRILNGFLLLFGFLADIVSLLESSLWSNELLSYMHFAFPNLSLDDFANSNASSSNFRKFLNQFFSIQQTRLLTVHKSSFLFEEIFMETRHLPLPKEAQLRIFDAMSEMEAMDYRNWNTEPLNTHREFFIYGSILYYNEFYLTSQMPVEMRLNVDCFLRCHGIFDFIKRYYVKEMYIWEEIILPNSPGRYFLTVCSRNHLILSVLLKMFDAPDIEPNAKISPSLFYIEEIQETLDHLIQCGIESLAKFWSISNKRPEVLDKIEVKVEADKDSSRFETFIKNKLIMSSLAVSNQLQREDESYLCSSLGGSSVQSEDDGSKKCLIPGNNGDGDSDSGSDWENFCHQNPLQCGLEHDPQTQMSESLWKEINNVIPVKISGGWKNSVLYYVFVDNANSSIFCPLNVNSDLLPFVKEMRKACFLIRNVLQGTKQLKKFIAHNTDKSSLGMLNIKEHSITIQIHDTSEKSVDSMKSRFVVVGRLFLSPMKEVYVCHRIDVPQNMVEMAFRLSFFAFG